MRVPPLETLERAVAAAGYMIAAGLGCCVVLYRFWWAFAFRNAGKKSHIIVCWAAHHSFIAVVISKMSLHFPVSMELEMLKFPLKGAICG